MSEGDATAWYAEYPSPIREIWGAAAEGRTAILLEGNTNDRVVSASKGLAPLGLNNAIFAVAARQGYHCGELSLARGFTPVRPTESTATGEPWPALHSNPMENPFVSLLPELLNALLSRESRRILIVNGADLNLPDVQTSMLGPEGLRAMHMLIEHGLSDAARRAGNLVILKAFHATANRGLLRSGAFVRIFQPLPDETARREFCDVLFTREGYAAPEEGIAPEEFARLTNGCRLTDIEGMGRKCSVEGTRIGRSLVREYKARSIESMSQGQLGVITPSRTMADVVGLPHVVRFFNYQQQLARAGSPSMPSIVLMMGTPGTGKSHIMEAYADLLGWTLLDWRNVRSMWVGESEARTEAALEIIRQNAPCLVRMDEADQAIGGRSVSSGDGGSGVDARIFSQLLAFTGDAAIRGKVQFLMASNRPDILDAAILDRAGAKIVFLNPTRPERAQLFTHCAKFQQREIEVGTDLSVLAGSPNLRLASVRNLHEVVQQAGTLADEASGNIGGPISAAALHQAVEEFNPGDTLETEYIALKCLQLIRFQGQLPWLGADGHPVAGFESPVYLESVVDPTSGRMDTDRLAAKVRETEQLRSYRHTVR